jgi:hypothetical protein
METSPLPVKGKFWVYILGAHGFWAGMGLYGTTPAVTQCLVFLCLIRTAVPFNRLLRIELARGCWGPTVPNIVKGTHYLASEIAFWRCGRVSRLITQVKLQPAWSSPGWVPASRCKMVAVYWLWCLVGSFPQVVLWARGRSDHVRMWFRSGTAVDVVRKGESLVFRRGCIR